MTPGSCQYQRLRHRHGDVIQIFPESLNALMTIGGARLRGPFQHPQREPPQGCEAIGPGNSVIASCANARGDAPQINV